MSSYDRLCTHLQDMKYRLLIAALLVLTQTIGAQVTVADSSALRPPMNPTLQAEDNIIIRERIEEWRDLKLGVLFQWGLYSQWAVPASWTLCSEPWVDRGGVDYMEYVQSYRKLNTTFKAKKFDPSRWAKNARDGGVKYVIFTAKHHDGFCLFDSKETNYTCTDKSCPNSKHSDRDISRAVVEAFRSKAFWTGFYFSKADWHHPDYWAPEWATPDRNVNYNPAEDPQRWQRYCTFVNNQVRELTHNYGGIDMLWLGAEWVRPEWSVDSSNVDMLGCRGYVQDVDVPTLARTAREKIPDLLISDQNVGGRYENYRVVYDLPNEAYPEEAWEYAMSVGADFAYSKEDRCHSPRELVHTLALTVARGGNLLLGLGPDESGRLPECAVNCLKELGDWLKVNGDAIYATRPVRPYTQDHWCFTQSKDKRKTYAIYLVDEGESIPEVLSLPHLPISPSKAKILGGGKVDVRPDGSGYSLYIRPGKKKDYAVVVVME